jgi:hypothetical protein
MRHTGFLYESSFCEYFTIATIVNRDNNFSAYVTVYNNVSRFDSIPCSIVQKKGSQLDKPTWEEFKDAILISDFWGLKEDNGYHGVDGNSLIGLGYVKAFKTPEGFFEKRSHVSRWGESMERLIVPFLKILEYCKIDKGCIK